MKDCVNIIPMVIFFYKIEKEKRRNHNFKPGTAKINRLRFILAGEESHHNPSSRNIPNPKYNSGVKNAKLCRVRQVKQLWAAGVNFTLAQTSSLQLCPGNMFAGRIIQTQTYLLFQSFF